MRPLKFAHSIYDFTHFRTITRALMETCSNMDSNCVNSCSSYTYFSAYAFLDKTWYSPYRDGHQYRGFSATWIYVDDPILGSLCQQIGYTQSLGIMNWCVLSSHTFCLLLTAGYFCIQSAVRTAIKFAIIDSYPVIDSKHGGISRLYYFSINCPCHHANGDSSSSTAIINS